MSEFIGYTIAILLFISLVFLVGAVAQDRTNKDWEQILVSKGYGEYTMESGNKVFKFKETK